MPRFFLVKNGLDAVASLLEEYKRAIYRYNSMIRGTGYYLKPIHVVVKHDTSGEKKYIYVGRYWWRVVYVGKKGKTSRVKWIYVGKEKPAELKDYPDPPSHILVGFSFIVLNDRDILVREDVFKRYRWIFTGYEYEEYRAEKG